MKSYAVKYRLLYIYLKDTSERAQISQDILEGTSNTDQK